MSEEMAVSSDPRTSLSSNTNKVPESDQKTSFVDAAALPTGTAASELAFVAPPTRGGAAEVATETSSSADDPTGFAETSGKQEEHTASFGQDGLFTVVPSAAPESPSLGTNSPPDRLLRVTVTSTFTVTSCEPTVTNCPLGKLLTSTVVLDATAHSGGGSGGDPTAAGTTATTYTLPLPCGKGETGCTTPTTVPEQAVATTRLTTQSEAVAAGSCTDCATREPTPLPPSSRPSSLTAPTPAQSRPDAANQTLPGQTCSDCSQTLVPPARPATSTAGSEDAPETPPSSVAVSPSEACTSCGDPTSSLVTGQGARQSRSSAQLSAAAVGLALFIAFAGL
ncbi:uncharacterized protein MAM_06593 [Metarhizium album ARSEF 1941]|uniref:Uncharacterized protein n=1 Tax=Metarhizium album (strain ARSEF 1941) TaxID=1081103 RepID=A0A0B2WHP0_METAS|nr:uncharacterized protein MAM_06593 [Metarhizium album ARSEF 1941]KHN95536.1 hypothetical protein MAM_06593 [Metarhizium album ARSEF 1941]